MTRKLDKKSGIDLPSMEPIIIGGYSLLTNTKEDKKCVHSDLVHKLWFSECLLSCICPCSRRDLDRCFQDGSSVKSMTAVLATGQISFCLVVIARQLGNSFTPLVGRLTTSHRESLSFCLVFLGLFFFIDSVNLSDIRTVFYTTVFH